jgi:hypothetical protein
MRWILANRAIPRCVFLMPPLPKRSKLNIAADWSAAVAALAVEGLSLPPYSPQGKLFRYDEHGRIVAQQSLTAPTWWRAFAGVAGSLARFRIGSAVQIYRSRHDPLNAAVRYVARGYRLPGPYPTRRIQPPTETPVPAQTHAQQA